MSHVPGELDDRLKTYRSLRRELERSIVPLATSVDGRRFTFQASLHDLAFQAGGYVVLEDGGEPRLGQVITLEAASREGPELAVSLADDVSAQSSVLLRYAQGAGVVLEGDGAPFHDVTARQARPDEVAAWLERTRPRRATLEVGQLVLAPGVPFDLDAGGFDRHTFLCGQSGSGKTYSLGLVLERLLLETDLRIVILDPNSDFVRLGSVREGADGGLAERYGGRASRVQVRCADGATPLQLAFPELDPAAQAAVLRLDPIRDREEYAALSQALDNWRPESLEELAASDSPDGQRLLQRATNLGVLRWRVWSRGREGSILRDATDPDVRCLVVDLGSLGSREEQALVAEGVLGRLWERRAERAPVLIVVDEAHNVCPAAPDDPLTALATEHAVRIAGEGRKFGLYLLVSTQRPQKVHENVLSQCDNLLLMRMNSTADLGYVGEIFSFVPQSLLERATTFRQGESLAAGKISPHPALLRFGARVSEEGGSDVPADWAESR
ncbi:MAG TPA: ATP-binding protein [Gaiellaceae bacterium]|nr:ATP-binding protein [Gaiellaceae bacterium]